MSSRQRGKGKSYLRRSTSRQELGIRNQLEWAIAEAIKLGVSLDARLEDIDYMEGHALRQLKDIFLDDGVTGADLEREAFTLFRKSVLADRSVSHVFIYQADRFARPEQAVAGMQLEIELLLAGVTVVFHNRLSEPRNRGLQYFAQNMTLLYEYSQSGQFLEDLAERVLRAQATGARKGLWAGGVPPYGFGRVLVDANDKVIDELPDGTYVRRDGCHVRIRPKDKEKIAVWLQILSWYSHGWGVKRIARQLNELGIPSPGAGREVVVQGVRRMASGKWDHRRVGRLIENRAIIGEVEYGKEALGAHRRFSHEGPRLLTDADRKPNGKAKSTRNDTRSRVVAPTGFEGAASREVFDACQEQKRQRGESQRGIRRSSPTDYPLSTRVYDLSPGCRKLMYGTKVDERRLYVCSKYSESKGRECQRNFIDAEAALRFTLAVLQQRVVQVGGRRQLRDRLMRLAVSRTNSSVHQPQSELKLAEEQHRRLEKELRIVGANLARSVEPDVFATVEAEFKALKRSVDQHDQRIRELRSRVDRSSARATPDEEVDKAMRLFDQLERISSDPAAREEVSDVLRNLNFLMGLQFAANPRKRPARIPAGGLITLGDPHSPIVRKHTEGVRPPVPDGSDVGDNPAVAGKELPTVGSGSRRQEACVGKGAGDSTPATRRVSENRD
jgi:DNA invertase Pin-like site-specific DNA recombinase